MRPIWPTSQSRTGWMAFVIALSVDGEFKRAGDLKTDDDEKMTGRNAFERTLTPRGTVAIKALRVPTVRSFASGSERRTKNG